MCHELNFKFKQPQNFIFPLKNLLATNSLMRNFLRDNFGMKRQQIFVLRRYIHGHDSKLMHIGIIQDLSLSCLLDEILIEDVRGQKVRPWCTLKRGAHLNHPVHHLCSVVSWNRMPVQGVYLLAGGARLHSYTVKNLIFLKSFLLIFKVHVVKISLRFHLFQLFMK